MSLWYLRRMCSVSLATCESMASRLSSNSVRAQSSVSDTLGAFFRSICRIERTTRAIWSARLAVTPGTLARTISRSRSSEG
jgi:hypothetical protein